MKKTIWKVSGSSPVGEAAGQALKAAGLGLLEKKDWDEVAAALNRGEATLVVADAEAVTDLAARGAGRAPALPREAARELAHQLRTPLSAMAGWLHLMESGTLDEAGRKFWSDKVVSLEAMDGPMSRCSGLKVVQAKGQWWNDNHDIHAFKTEGAFVYGDQFALRFEIGVTA